jgi:hypothetical protein
MNMPYEITVYQLTPEFLEALIRWYQKKTAKRSVKIEIPPLWIHEEGAVSTVWCHDHEYHEGGYATCIDDIPTDDLLLKKMQKRIEEERQELIIKLQQLEAAK